MDKTLEEMKANRDKANQYISHEDKNVRFLALTAISWWDMKINQYLKDKHLRV